MIINRNRTSGSSRLPTLLCVFFFIADGIAVLCATGIGERELSAHSDWHVTSRSSKIAPWVIERTTNGQKAEFFVVLTDQADLSGAAALTTKIEKVRYVYDALRNKSWATQTPILQWLREHRIEHGSFYIVNAVLVKGSREVAEELASRQDVARIEGNPHIQNSLFEPAAVARGLSLPHNPETIEPNITYTRAGCLGAGVQRAGNYSGRRRYWSALDTQR
jgi:serine protease AprX